MQGDREEAQTSGEHDQVRLPRDESPPRKRRIELIIARYEEHLEWLAYLPRSVAITVYNKGWFGRYIGLPQRARCWQMPNKGREAGTYLHHILNSYNRLADVTLFVQGNPFDHAPHLYDVLKHIMAGSLPSPESKGFLPLGHFVAIDDPEGRPNHWRDPPSPIPVGELYEAAFGRPAPDSFRFTAGAQFAATRDAIRSRPRDWWLVLKQAFDSYPEDAGAAHAMERLWANLLTEEL